MNRREIERESHRVCRDISEGIYYMLFLPIPNHSYDLNLSENKETEERNEMLVEKREREREREREKGAGEVLLVPVSSPHI